MLAIASALMRRLPWRKGAVALLLAWLPALLWAQATIQITPLPEAKHAAVTPLGATDLSASDVQPWLDAEMSGVMQKGSVTGAVVVVVRDGQILFSKGYGYADPDEKKAIDPATTMFRVGAMSGVVTSTAVMQLVEQHKLELDADVNRYLDFTIPPLDGKPVTLRDLLTYTPGFEDVVKDLYITDAKLVDSNEIGIHRGRRVPARIYPAGEVPAYSTYGMALAGYIVQRTSGQRFDEYTERHIFEPMGLHRTTFRQSRALWAVKSTEADVAGWPASATKLIIPTPALGLAISGEDMARLMIAYLQYGRAGNAQLLEQTTVQQMLGYRGITFPSQPGMALGWAQLASGEPAMLAHSGDLDNSHSLLALIPEHHTGIFIATAGGDAKPLLRPLIERFSDRYFPPLPQLKQPTLGTDKQHAAQLTGRYTSSITAQSTVLALRDLFHQGEISVAADGSLVAPMFGTAHWREVKPYQWVDDSTGRRLAAVVRDGKVRMVSTDVLSPTEVYLPATGASPHSVASVVSLLAAVFALIGLSWPVMAWLGRRHASLALPDQDVRWYRLSRLTAFLYLLFAGGWCLILPRLGMPHLEMRLALLLLVGSLAVLGTVPAAMETWRAWQGKAWWRRISSTVLLLACLGAIAFIASWHLLSFDPSY
jgi:CubicO group peptidase (beta-lactamase class C family)